MTLLNYAHTRAELQIRWTPAGATAPFATQSATELLLSQATMQASERHVIRIGPTTLDPSTLTAGLQIVPDAAAANPQFAIAHWQSGGVDLFASFTDFVRALATDLSGTTPALQIEADGTFDATTGVLSVDRMTLVLNN